MKVDNRNLLNSSTDQSKNILYPDEIYGIYNQLLTDGYLTIDTHIFNSVNILNQHFENILALLLDGIETDQIQSLKVNILFSDNINLKLTIIDYWFNLIFWELPVSVGDEISSKFLYFDEAITQNTIKSWIDNNFIDKHRTDFSDIQLNNFIDNSIHKFKYIDRFSFYLMNTSNNEDTIELMKNNQTVFDAIHCDLSKVPTEDVKNIGMDWTYKLITEIKNSNHWAKPYFMAKEGINIKQFREFLVNIGTVPDGEGSIFPYILNTNYNNRGVNEVKDYIIDAHKARSSQEISKMNVGIAGAFARILGLNNTDTLLYNDPEYKCNTKNFVKRFIKNDIDLNKLKHRFYKIYEDGPTLSLGSHPEKTHKHLIGQTIYTYSPITCASGARGEGICYRCYGNLAYTNNNINIGRFASEELSSKLTQKLLSAKHLLESAVRKMMWIQNFSVFFDLDFSSFSINKEFNEKKYRLVIANDNIEIDDEYEQSDYNEHISYCNIIDPQGNIVLTLSTVDKDDLFISPGFSEMIHKRKEDTEGNISFDLDEIKDIELFMVKIVNNELSLTLDKIKNIINKKSEVQSLKDKDSMISELANTVNEGGINIDSIHLEVLLSNQCVNEKSNLLKPEWEYPNEPYRMITLNEALRDNPSVAISLMYEKIDKALYNPLTFKKTAPSSIDLFYMVNPQDAMSIKTQKSDIISEKEGDMIKPFSINNNIEE